MTVPENDPWPQRIRESEQARRFLERQLAELPGVAAATVTLRLLVEVTIQTDGAPNELLDMLVEDLEEQVYEQFPDLVVDTFIKPPVPES